MAPNSKLKNPINKITAKFSREAYFKISSKILKKVGGVAILVIEIELKAQTDIQLICDIFEVFWP